MLLFAQVVGAVALPLSIAPLARWALSVSARLSAMSVCLVRVGLGGIPIAVRVGLGAIPIAAAPLAMRMCARCRSELLLRRHPGSHRGELLHRGLARWDLAL